MSDAPCTLTRADNKERDETRTVSRDIPNYISCVRVRVYACRQQNVLASNATLVGLVTLAGRDSECHRVATHNKHVTKTHSNLAYIG